jgi:hypothetical protein
MVAADSAIFPTFSVMTPTFTASFVPMNAGSSMHR